MNILVVVSTVNKDLEKRYVYREQQETGSSMSWQRGENRGLGLGHGSEPQQPNLLDLIMYLDQWGS